MARTAEPKWKKEFKKRMREQLKLFAKCKDSPTHLTKWEYTNGKVVIAWGRRRDVYVPKSKRKAEYRWVPNQ